VKIEAIGLGSTIIEGISEDIGGLLLASVAAILRVEGISKRRFFDVDWT